MINLDLNEDPRVRKGFFPRLIPILLLTFILVLLVAQGFPAQELPSPPNAPISVGRPQISINVSADTSATMLDSGWRFLPDPTLSLPPLATDLRWLPISGTFSARGQKPPGPWAGGWFEIRLKVDPGANVKDLALRLEHPGASEIYLNGRLLRTFGRLGVDLGGEQPFNPRGIPIPLDFEDSAEHRLSIRYTCVDAARPWVGDRLVGLQGGGFAASIDSASRAAAELDYTRALNMMLNLGLGGMALGFFFLHGLIYLYYRRHAGNFWFAMFALGLALNGFCTTLLKFWGHFGLWGFAGLRMLNLLAAGVLLLSVLLFLAQLSSKATFASAKGLAGAWVMLMATPLIPLSASAFGSLYLAWLVVFFIATLRAGLNALREKPEGGRWLGLSAAGVLILLCTEAFKQLNWLLLVHEIIGFGLSVFLILAGASCFLARRIAAERQELEHLARNLEQRVQDRTRDLERSKHAAQAANRAKSEFLAVMSHEIRTPMNAVVGLAELLDQADIPAREQKMAGTLKRSAVSLLRLIDEILDLSRIEAGNMNLRSVPFSIQQILDDVVELLSARARQADLELSAEVEGPGEDPGAIWILGDGDRFYQILINLVGNALKFTDHGSISMTARWAPVAEGRLDLALDVADTGIGISQQDQETLFDPFVQVDSTSTRRVGGAGLGLAICRQLTDLMGGELSVTSELGQGSCFTLRLTADIAEGPPSTEDPAKGSISTDSPVSPSPDPPLKLAPLRILLAEDNPINQWVVKLLLEELGQSARVVDEGSAVLEILAKEAFDVVVLDLHMPGMDGFEVASRIRSQFGEKPYLIAFTASAMDEDRRRCTEVGMNDFLSKPADLDRLGDALQRASEALEDGAEPDASRG